MSEQRPGRYPRTFAGMVGAMVVLVVLVLVWVGFRALTSSDPPSPVRTVSYATDAAAAAKVAPFELLAPRSLPKGWRATTVRFTDQPEPHWHLGVLTDRDRYVGLEQSDRPAETMVSQYVDKKARSGGPVTIGRGTWRSWTDSGGDRALVRSAGGFTTLVVGHDVPARELSSYVESLASPRRAG